MFHVNNVADNYIKISHFISAVLQTMHRTLGKYCNTRSVLDLKYDNICFLNDILFTIRRDAQRQNIRCFSNITSKIVKFRYIS